ncbi:MAG: hypothetical protein N3G18_03085, partial [Candidatus Saccharicenans sp.]|nr:hypothetical protein [Candidatus Saccharicenans sp.]
QAISAILRPGFPVNQAPEKSSIKIKTRGIFCQDIIYGFYEKRWLIVALWLLTIPVTANPAIFQLGERNRVKIQKTGVLAPVFATRVIRTSSKLRIP